MEEKTEERGRGCMTTLCYIEKDDSYLMMHRTVKKNDVNKDKWIGVGGHAELGESPEECLLREVKEETGYTLTSWRFRGLVTFVTEAENSKTVEYMEYMCLYTADGFTGEPTACDEGELAWATRAYWNGCTRTRWRRCPSGRGTRSFWTSSAVRTRRFSP